MKLYKFRLLFTVLFFQNLLLAQQGISHIVPLGGNSWLKNGQTETLKNDGWANWTSGSAIWNTYFKAQKTGKISISIKLRVPDGESEISFQIGAIAKRIYATGNKDSIYFVGDWEVGSPQYITLMAQGVKKTGVFFGEASELIISGPATDSAFSYVKDNEGSMYHFGRRGPSVHFNYETPKDKEIEWFYNEITISPGNDVVGSYFMANGFAEGYFGIQVNSETERRIIFSVWSPYNTDNKNEVPQDQKIILKGRGKNVVADEFGGEGSGGHSHLVYNWKTSVAYKFLLNAIPQSNNSTTYTAYFYDPETAKWLLIASFNRPYTSTYLKGLYSFLENFHPESGITTRRGYYHNQWIKPKGAAWMSISKATFTGDVTARKGYRMDYNGGIDQGRFFLENCGFFNTPGELRKQFSLPAWQNPPTVDLTKLKRE